MAPLPDNKKTEDKTEQDQSGDKSAQKDEKTLSNLDDLELRALLDEAMNYKNPKDREGKSELFNDLLLEAEESERIARATSAGGSELARHCNQQARRQRHGGLRGRRSGGHSSGLGRSVSERGTHGGSLDNLAKEELYETGRRLRGGRKSSTSSSGTSSGFCGNQVRVSARQREGGSLPCNVNSGATSRDFLFSKEEANKNIEMKEKEYNMELEKEHLIDNDHLARGYEERLIDGEGQSLRASSAVETHIVTATPKYTSKATLHIQSNRVTAVDDPIALDIDNVPDNKLVTAQSLSTVVKNSKYQVIIPSYPKSAVDDKKVDENGNALHQAKDVKKKKKQADKNVVVLRSENIEGHKSEIINNVDQLLHYIEGTTEIRARTVQSRSKQLQKQHTTDEGGAKANRKKHKSKESGEEELVDVRPELKKSNSLGEISGIKLDRQFNAFGSAKNKREKEDESVVLRNNKSLTDRARERRSWGTVEPHSIQTLYNASSLENLETSTDNWEVTRPKKKNKKRRNSVSSTSSVRQTSSLGGVSNIEDHRARRAPSPNLGGISGMCNVKTTRSMPHSERSNDSSSDVDSVHSLPLDGPISYADIAKNSEKKKSGPEKPDRPATTGTKETSPCTDLTTTSKNITVIEKASSISNPPTVITKSAVPDVHNIKSFPAIPGVTKSASSAFNVDEAHTVTNTSEKAVQSTNYEDTLFVCEKTSIVNQKVSVETVKSVVTTQAAIASTSTSSVSETVSVSNTATTAGEKRQTTSSSAGRENGGKNVKKLHNHTVQGFFGLHGDGTNDISLMRDSTHYPSQRMPPDIMDVSTIEKMQFLNCNSGHESFTVTPNNRNTQTSFQVSCASAPGSLSGESQNHPTGSKGKRKKATPKDGDTINSGCDEASKRAPICDTSLNEVGGSGGRMVNGISDDLHYSSPESYSFINDVPVEDPDSPPAVVILSGVSKDVPPSGLVFGFDINEQLLLEDSGGGGNSTDNSNFIVSGQTSSENKIGDISIELLASLGDRWAKRYKPPIYEGLAKYNHDRIVQFISEAWEDVQNQKIKYYSNGL